MTDRTSCVAYHFGSLLLLLAVSAVRVEAVDFNREIRPILFGRCVACHGPDEAERAADLRLDIQVGSREDLGGHSAVVPGNLDASALVERITSTDPDVRMPPPESGPALSEQEVELFRTWILEGASYAKHWSYEKPIQPPVPIVKRIDWPRNAIDYFVLAKLEASGLTPNPEANPYTLARRLSLDLIGLPPAWDEVDAFAHDPSASAYEKFVDRLLANPAFGERWSRVWLDLARYADSAGYADDPLRTIWAYRDYVIRSLNENKPFDQFTIEQMAGDLLESPTVDQIIATAFHRNTMTNSEGGTNDEEFRSVAIVDRVNTTMAVWMGTTMACAQCHTHKYDPITQNEYFRFYAILNHTADRDLKDESPLKEIWDPSVEREKHETQEQLNALEKSFSAPSEEWDRAQQQWIESLTMSPEWKPLTPKTVTAKTRKLKIDAHGWIVAEGDKPERDQYELEFEVGESQSISGFRLEIPESQQNNFVLSQVVVRWLPAGKELSGEAPQTLPLASAAADFEQSGFSAKSVLREKVPEVDQNLGWAIAGQTGKTHWLDIALREPRELSEGKLTISLNQSSKHAQHLLDHFRVLNTSDASVREWAKLDGRMRELLSLASEKRSAADNKSIMEFFRSVSLELQPERDELKRLKDRLAQLKPITTVPVMQELQPDQRRTTHVQLRGNYQSLGEQVTEGTPAAFHPLTATSSPTRLDLAKWLVDQENPLTPRVIVNRHWEQLFGIGIVETSEEFGSQGELPTHPELLDWLAVELRENGWDLKSLLKTIVMSATYRQVSTASAERVEADPRNRWLGRGPRFRGSAELVRDQSLAVAGLISYKQFGPPVNPPQPNLGLTAAFGSATDWKTSDGEDRYRRALYTMWRRSSPYPSMAQFDAPNREVCTVRRNLTNTPLQALVTLNDPVYVEAAQSLARRLLREANTDTERARLAYRICLSREPTEIELARVEKLRSETYAVYATKPDEAKFLATEPLGPLPDRADVAQAAAWTVVGNVLLNLDEFLMRR